VPIADRPGRPQRELLADEIPARSARWATSPRWPPCRSGARAFRGAPPHWRGLLEMAARQPAFPAFSSTFAGVLS
jgi:hypothetical protein